MSRDRCILIGRTTVLSCLMRALGYKYTIIIGLVLQAVQLFIYGIWTTPWLMWVAGVMAALSTIIYPAISALVSKNADPEQQGERVVSRCLSKLPIFLRRGAGHTHWYEGTVYGSRAGYIRALFLSIPRPLG